MCVKVDGVVCSGFRKSRLFIISCFLCGRAAPVMAEIPQEFIANIKQCDWWLQGWCKKGNKCPHLHSSYVDKCGRRWSGHIPKVSLFRNRSTRIADIIKSELDYYISKALDHFFSSYRRERTLVRGTLQKVKGFHCIQFSLEHMNIIDREAIENFNKRGGGNSVRCARQLPN